MSENKITTASSRRTFLTRTALIPAAVTMALSGSAFADSSESETTTKASTGGNAKKLPIGLELYSVRSELSRDLPNTLRRVSGMGYEVVEFYSPYCDWSIPYC